MSQQGSQAALREHERQLREALALHTSGRLAEAQAAYATLLAARPDHAATLFYTGTLAGQLGDVAGAVTLLQHALERQPDAPMTLSNLATFLTVLGRTDEALAMLERLLRLERKKPSGPRALAALWDRMGGAHKAAGDIAEAVGCYERAMAAGEGTSAERNRLYALQYCVGVTPQQLREAHEAWAAKRPASAPRRRPTPEDDPRPERTLRVGFVAPDFRDHCQSLFTVPLLANVDPAQWEVTCYSDVQRPDAVTQRLQGLVAHWRQTVGWSDERLAAQVRADRIDVLVDLTLHMSGGRLEAYLSRPAPVQVTWLGYPGTTGLDCIDYRLTDPHIDPPGNESFYVEESWPLPDTFWCYDPLTTELPTTPLPALERGHVTFGCLNNFCKVNAPLLALWSRVLSAVPGSRLLLLAAEGSRRDWVRAELQRGDVSPDRVSFVSKQPRLDYLRTWAQIDLGLDTFPYNGHTTSLDAFWMGVPVVTKEGVHSVGRAGLSLARNLGLDELVAADEDGFVATAARLAGDLPALARLRSGLRGRMERSPLMDGARFARGMESAFRGMWRRFCAGG